MVDFRELREAVVHGDVLTPGDDGYESSLRRWNAAIEKKAAVVMKPACAQEVSAAIRFAVAHEIPLTTCGGGHASSGSLTSEGMIIDLSYLRSVSVDQQEMMVSFGGGCIWEDLEKALDPLGLATVGGVVNHTGVGGLILGGGHGYLTPTHGLTIDNLTSIQMVTADGSILETSEDDNADLFWAARGAGAQFGIATRFVSRVHQQGPVYSGALLYDEGKLGDIVAASNDFHNRDNRDGHCLTIGLGHGEDGQSRAVTVTLFYRGSETEGRKFFSRFFDAGPKADMTKIMMMGEVNELLNPMAYFGIRRLMGTGNVVMPIDASDLQNVADKLWNFCASNPDAAPQTNIAIELFPTNKIRDVAQSATAYANRGEYYDAVTMFGWTDPALDTEVRQFNRSMVRYIRETLGYTPDGNKGAPVGMYVNLETEPVKPEDAFGANLERLRDVKRRFDPENVFNKWHSLVEKA